MTIEYLAKWGPHKDKLTGRELQLKYYNASDCLVTVVPGEQYPKLVHIEFTGEAARIPSLKNSKLAVAGRLVTGGDATARLKVMDRLFLEEVEDAGYSNWRFRGTHIHVTAIFAERSRATNEDNLISTLKDWLEPGSYKKGGATKSRGWGIGLIEDDIYAHGYPVVGEMLGAKPETTTIIIRPLEDMKKAIATFVAEAYTG